MTKHFVEFTKKIKWNNVFFKTALLSIIFIFIPIIIVGGILIQHNIRITNEQIETYRANSHNQVENTWHDITSFVYETQMLIQNTSLNNEFTSNPNYAFSDESSKDVNTLTEILKSAVNSSQFVSSVYVYNANSGYVMSTISNAPLSHFVELSWYDKLDEYTDKGFFLRKATLNRENFTYLSSIQQFSAYPYCYSVYNVDYYALRSYFSTDKTIEDIYITDANNIIVFCMDTSLIGKDINSIDDFPSDSKDIKLTKTTDSYGQVYYTLSKSNSNALFSNFSLLIVILLILLLVSSTLSSYILTVGFRRSILKIISTIPQSNLKDAETAEPTNEIGFITKSISELITKNNQFEEQLALQLSKLKKSQVMALQEQINPHFLFNTLNLISLLDRSEQKKEYPISKIAILTADILRYILKTKEYLVPVENEILYVKKYIELQSIKYENDFNIIWDIDPGTTKLYIVKFSLQPIVENAIMHGFVNMDNTENKIKISTRKEDNYLEIKISNNGVTIEPLKLEMLNSQIENNTSVDSNHIGLLNVCLRYRLLFDKNFFGKISSEEGVGTTVTLKFPVIDSYDF